MIEIKINPEQIARVVRKLNSLKPEERNPLMQRAWINATLVIEAGLKKSVSGPILKVRSGQLRNSIQSRINFKDGNIKSIIGSGTRTGKRVPYANIHETGGIIRPTNSKYLAIPLKAARTASGVGRFSPRQIESNGFEGSFFFTSKKGTLILAGVRGKSITPLFALKRSVKIPARRYMSRTADQYGKKAVNVLEKTIQAAINK